MGYQVTFKPTEEVMEAYKAPNNFCGSYNTSEANKLTLLVTTLLEEDKEKPINIPQFVFNTKLTLASLQSQIERDEKQNAYERWKGDDEHELWFCGWEFAKDEPDTTTEDAINYVVRQLTILHYCAKTEDYFVSESKMFDKIQEIDGLLEYFEDAVRTNVVFEIMHDLKDYKIHDDNDE